MKNNAKKKSKFKLPKRSLLLYLCLFLGPILLFLLIAIPVLYVNEYNAKKVTPFESDLKEVTDVIYGDKNTITDFDIFIYCTSYDDNNGSVSFKYFMTSNENTASTIKPNSQVSVKLGLCSDWIKTDVYSSSRTRKIATNAKTALGSSSYYGSFSMSGIPNLPMNGSLPFIKISTIPLYAYVTYTTLENGQSIPKKYLLKYEYNDYIIGKLVFDEGTENEVTVVPTTGGIEK